MNTSVPIVDYLVLGDSPHLVAQECTRCAAHYFDHRDGCANCFGAEFTSTPVPSDGTLETFTIVSVPIPGIAVPFVAGVVDCGGIPVRSNIVNVEPSAHALHLGMPLKLTTFEIGVDDTGAQAIGFGFEPVNSKDAS